MSDSLTQTPLFGANIYLVGTSLGTASDMEGNFSIPRIDEGTHFTAPEAWNPETQLQGIIKLINSLIP